MATPPKADAAGGDLVWDLGRGELFLRGDTGHVYRLAWADGEKDPRRRIPAGSYALLGYRVARKAKDGTEWFLSAASNGTSRLTVSAGREKRPPIDARVHLQVRAPSQRGKQQVQAGLQGKLRSSLLEQPRPFGLSLYRDGKRIPLLYRVVDKRGSIIHSGTLRYG